MDELPPTSTWATPSNTNSWRAAGGPAQPGGPLVPAKSASPQLGDELFGRLVAYGKQQETLPGDVLFGPGDVDVDLIVVARGSVDVIRTETADVRRRPWPRSGRWRLRRRTESADRPKRLPPVQGPGGRHGRPGRTGASAPAHGERWRALGHHLQGADRTPGAAAAQHRRPGCGDRRQSQVGLRPGAADLRRPPACLIHVWFDADSPAGEALMGSAGLTEDDLPAVVMPGATLKRATPGMLGQAAEPHLSPLH